MPSSPPRSHRVRERDTLTLQEYFTTDRAPLRGASMRARDQSSGVAGMIRVTRDKAKLRGVDYVMFWVWWLEPPIFSNEKASVCGAYWDPELKSWNSQKRPFGAPAPTPAVQAFYATYRFAVDKGFPAIWIDDPDRRFGYVDVEPWVRNGLIDYLDDHS
jgi:hypothetical protein